MKTAKPIPDGRQRLTPYLIVRNAAKAIEFYENAFGAKEVFRLTEPQGKIGHAELRIGDSLLMLADEYPDFGALGPASIGGSPVSIHLYVEDVDRVVAGAAAAGATLLRAVMRHAPVRRGMTASSPAGYSAVLRPCRVLCPS